MLLLFLFSAEKTGKIRQTISASTLELNDAAQQSARTNLVKMAHFDAMNLKEHRCQTKRRFISINWRFVC